MPDDGVFSVKFLAAALNRNERWAREHLDEIGCPVYQRGQLTLFSGLHYRKSIESRAAVPETPGDLS